jgi:hypothetical protein
MVVGNGLPNCRVDARFVENVAGHDCPNANDVEISLFGVATTAFSRRMVGQRFAGVNPRENAAIPGRTAW